MSTTDDMIMITTTQQMMSSCIGAVITSLCMTPLDVVKIRLQAQQKPFKTGSAFIYSNGLMDCLCVCSHCNDQPEAVTSRLRPWYERPGHFKGTLDAFVKITRAEGVTALWSGLPPTLLMSIPSTVVYFTSYDRLKYAMGYNETDPSTKYVPIYAGSLARAVAVTIFNPLELLRTKMMSKRLSYFQLKEGIRLSIENNGLSFIMKGLGPSLFRDIPFSAIYWFGYEITKSYQIRHNQTSRPNLLVTFLSGALCGSVAAVLTLPFDVIKTLRQIELGEAEVQGGSKKLTSTWKLVSELYKKKGLSGLYAGIIPRLLKIAPACAIMITSYEFTKAFFRQRNQMES